MTVLPGPPPNSTPPKPVDGEYRTLLIAGEHKAQTDFDKTVITLSGGALGITFAFLEKLLGAKAPIDVCWLHGAWAAWVASLAFVLSSHYFSALAMRRALEQYDAGKLPAEHTGGNYDRAIPVLNALGGIAFLVGAVSAGVFLVRNL